ncbi:FimB/Mfa2 family fimbrial subunit [Proteiniphilum sp. X52]|uniref:FimB/Mfa2 family fimbrial subunit n=1 Tax=Proteiniphilum sp. X52 TaxID=2382159 RepID=UPI000F0A2AF0|nr:FimB/Mfa2 family fimbrial subunit [Proteiniphilum sp. X52]RNC65917.1 hypothetical protein D7D25_05205 [Proteiniphilum sp. X52]
MNTSTFKTRTHYFYGIAFLLFALLSYSCNDRNGFDTEDRVESSLSIQLRSDKAETLIDNTSIYMFDATNRFVEKKLNVTRQGNKLSTNVAVGTWNIVLLTCDRDISENISVPPPTSPMGTTTMWQTKTVGNFLPQTPSELRYVSLPNVTIEKDVVKQVSTLLYRNVAKLQVILKHYGGFDEITDANKAMAYAELLEVPTTLAWNGKLYPNGGQPDVSEKPMRENFTFKGNGVADTLNFFVPAHRGNDAFIISDGVLIQNPAPADTSTHKLKLRVSMPLDNKEYFGKSANGIEIPYVPKVNGIIRINVTFYGTTSLDIKVGVKPWEDWIIQEEEF